VKSGIKVKTLMNQGFQGVWEIGEKNPPLSARIFSNPLTLDDAEVLLGTAEN